MTVVGLISPMRTTMSLTIIVVIFLTLLGTGEAAASSLPFPVRTVYEWPVDTFVENIAVRSNGQLLVTALTSNSLFLLNSIQTGQPAVVHTFDGYQSLTGIAEYQADIFAVSVGNASLAGPLAANFSTPSTFWSVWSVDLRGVQLKPDGVLQPAPLVSKIVDIQNILLNGISLLSEAQGTLLLSDYVGGQIFRLDVHTGSYQVVIANSFTAPVSIFGNPPWGANGLHVREDAVYITNYGKRLFAKLPINADGTPDGEGTIVANTTFEFDDFAFDSEGNAYLVTRSGNSVLRVSPDGKKQDIIAGNVYSTEIADPTSAAFGRGPWDKNTLYVTTTGGIFAPINGSIVVGGQVVAITTDAEGAPTLF